MRRAALAVAAFALLLPGANCEIVKEGDPLLNRDAFDGARWDAAEIVPGTPWIVAGPDREIGTDDDRIRTKVVGDVDLVLRSARTTIGATVPPPTAASAPTAWPIAIAEPFGEGVAVPYVVVPVDGHTSAPFGTPGAPPYWNGLALLVLAFADLDGDGFIGVTLLDGNALDAALEEAEWEPVGRAFAIGAGSVASGALQIGVGGPAARPARVALAAAAWAGATDPGFMGGNVAVGPAVTTRLPFLPELAPQRVLEGGAAGPGPATPDSLVGVEVRVGYAPDPADPRIGEAFTLRLDGSDATIDTAFARSGAANRFGVVQVPDPLTYRGMPARPLRPAVASGGGPRAVEVLTRARVADDGSASRALVSVVALDRLDDVTEPAVTTAVTLRTSGPVRIAFPDLDGNPHVEMVLVSDAVGAAVELDDTGAAFDGPDDDTLVVETATSIARIPLLLPDPDVDDSGLVDDADFDAIDAHDRERLGDPDFDARYDLDGSGRIDELDLAIATAHEGEPIPIP